MSNLHTSPSNTVGNKRSELVQLTIIMTLVLVLPISALMVAVFNTRYSDVNTDLVEAKYKASIINNDVGMLLGVDTVDHTDVISREVNGSTNFYTDEVDSNLVIGTHGFVLLASYFGFDDAAFYVDIPTYVRDNLSTQVIAFVDEIVSTINDIYLSGGLVDVDHLQFEAINTHEYNARNRDWGSDFLRFCGAVAALTGAVSAAIGTLWWGAKIVAWGLHAAMVASSTAAMTGIGILAYLAAAGLVVVMVIHVAAVRLAWNDVQYRARKLI